MMYSFVCLSNQCGISFRVITTFLMAGFIVSGCASNPKSSEQAEVEQRDRLFDTCRAELSSLQATGIIKSKLPDSRSLTQANLRDSRQLDPSEKAAMLEYAAKRNACWAMHLSRKGKTVRGQASLQLYKPFQALRDQNTAALFEDKITVGQYNQNRQHIAAAYKRDLLTLESRLALAADGRAASASVLAELLENGALHRCQQEMDIDRVIDGF